MKFMVVCYNDKRILGFTDEQVVYYIIVFVGAKEDGDTIWKNIIC